MSRVMSWARGFEGYYISFYPLFTGVLKSIICSLFYIGPGRYLQDRISLCTLPLSLSTTYGKTTRVHSPTHSSTHSSTHSHTHTHSLTRVNSIDRMCFGKSQTPKAPRRTTQEQGRVHTYVTNPDGSRRISWRTLQGTTSADGSGSRTGTETAPPKGGRSGDGADGNKL